jgi:hypothetical protein
MHASALARESTPILRRTDAALASEVMPQRRRDAGRFRGSSRSAPALRLVEVAHQCVAQRRDHWIHGVSIQRMVDSGGQRRSSPKSLEHPGREFKSKKCTAAVLVSFSRSRSSSAIA